MTTATETSWASTRTKYSVVFGAPPQPLDDNDIAAVFRNHPFDVISELERLAQSFTAGKVHSPWRALCSKLDKIAGDHDHVNVTGELRVRQAEAWIRNAGLYCPSDGHDSPDTSRELFDALFDATSALLAGLEAELGPRMLALWRAERGRAAAAGADYLARAARNRVGKDRDPSKPFYASREAT